MTSRAPGRLAVAGTLAAGFTAAYLGLVRPRLLRAGATAGEVLASFPGARIIPDGARSATMAVTIDAPRSRVWPWLLQMGTDRGGWYSWDRLDNFGRRSAGTVHPEWQDTTVGDHLAATPDGSQWWEVAALEPEQFLGLRMSLDLRGRPFDPAEMAAAAPEHCGAGALALGHADQAVLQFETPRRVRSRLSARNPQSRKPRRHPRCRANCG